MDFPWLTVVGAVPLAGALAVTAIPKRRVAEIKSVAIAFATVSLALTIAMMTQFNGSARQQFQLVEDRRWISDYGIGYRVGVDGVALLLIALTAFLVPIVLLASWNVESKTKSFFALVLLLETALIGCFAATDVFLFYVFFEVMLVPMYFLIGVWGGERRVYAAVKFFLYTLLAGLLMLVAILAVYLRTKNGDLSGIGAAGTFEYSKWLALDIPHQTQNWLFLGFAIAFAVKVPLFPFHTWLPDAHTEAPTGGSVLLAGVMLKIGTFGFLRYSIPLFPHAAKTFAMPMMILGLIGIFYGALVAIVQKDLKRLVAYTSIAHLGFIVLGLFAFTSQGQAGAVLYMINHGLSTGALFLIIGFLYERRHTRLISEYGGLRAVMPVLAGTFLIAGLSSLALPGLNGFVSEFLVLLGTYSRHPALGIIATFGIVLAALYILIAYQRTMQGELTVEANRDLKDLTLREKIVIGPVLLLIVALGVFPAPALRIIEPAVNRVLERVEKVDPAPTLSETAGSEK